MGKRSPRQLGRVIFSRLFSQLKEFYGFIKKKKIGKGKLLTKEKKNSKPFVNRQNPKSNKYRCNDDQMKRSNTSQYKTQTHARGAKEEKGKERKDKDRTKIGQRKNKDRTMQNCGRVKPKKTTSPI